MKIHALAACLLTVLAGSFLTGCRSPYLRDQGALIGGLAGAGVGAAIGENNNKPLAGAAIGAAVGTLAGAAIGDSMDQEIERNNAIIEQRLGQRLAGAATIEQVVSMSQAGLSDEVIITHIRANGVAQRPSANDLIAMKQQGVSDRVLNAMQSQPPITAAPARYSRPAVIVEEYHYGGPGCYWPRYRPYPPRHRSGMSWGFSYHGHR